VITIESVDVTYNVHFDAPVRQQNRTIRMGHTEVLSVYDVHYVKVTLFADGNVSIDAFGRKVGKSGKPLARSYIDRVPMCYDLIVPEQGETRQDTSRWDTMLDVVRENLVGMGVEGVSE